MRLAVARCLLAGLCCVPAAAGAIGDGSIGVYGDAAGVSSSALLSIGVPRTLYVVVLPGGRTTAGLSGAEFRILGLPADWLVFVTPNPAATVVLGDPFRDTNGTHRANIAFSDCVAGGGPALLYTVVVVPLSMATGGDLTVEAGSPPTNPLFTTPVLTLCDSPEFTKVPAAGAAFHFDVRTAQDLDYAPFPGYDLVRGVQPFVGAPGEVFHFRVSYSNLDGSLPPAGSPRLELDANGDGDALDAGEGAFTLWAADLDSTLANGKDYRYDVALPAPPGGRYRYRFTAASPIGTPVPGHATAWNDSLFVSAAVPDLVVRAENIRVLPAALEPNRTASILALIENASDVAVQNIVVRVTDVFGNQIEERSIARMGPHTVTEFGCTWRFPDQGFQPIAVRVDPADVLAERSESNNLALHGVRVGGVTGNLRISGIPSILHTSPVAPLALAAHAEYPPGSMPGGPAAAAAVLVRPSWEAPWTVRTNAAGDFSTVLIPPAAPGIYFASVLVTDGVQTDSVVSSVVVAPADGTDGPHLANLAVEIFASTGGGCPETAADISVRVHNTGDVASSSTSVRILRDAATEVALVPVGALAPGSSAELGPLPVPLPGPGLHTFTVVALPANAAPDLRTDDNFASATVRAATGCLDLAVREARITAANLCAGTPLTVSLRAINPSCASAAASRVAAFANGGEVAGVFLPSLAPGESTSVELVVPWGTACGDWTFAVDPEGAAGTDCEPDNNALSVAACPGACDPPSGLPNFIVHGCDIEAVPDAVMQGSPTFFTAWIANNGTPDADLPVAVRFRVDGVDIGDAVPAGPIPAGARIRVTAPAPWIVDLARHELSVAIEAPGQEAPGGDADNVAVRVLPWNLRLVPIMNCPPASPSMFSDCAPCAEDAVGIHAQLVNDGPFVVDNALVEYRDGGVPIGTRTLHNIVPNGCGAAAVPLAFSWAFAEGLHRISVVANPDSAIFEPTYGDNEFSGELTVACPATIDLSCWVERLSNPYPLVGDTIRAVDITVSNAGSAPAPDVVVRVTLDGVPLCDVLAGTIPRRSRRTLRCDTPWVVTSPLCSQTIEACADPFDQIQESSEINNCAQGGVCLDTDFDLGLSADLINIQPQRPAAGDTVTIRVGLYNVSRAAATCELSVEWQSGDTWLAIGSAPVTLPEGVLLPLDVAAFVWVAPVPLPIALRFQIRNIVPADLNPYNDVLTGMMPWNHSIPVPVTVSDLAAGSTADGVHIAWRCGDPSVELFALERSAGDGSGGVRLPDPVPANGRSGGRDYQYLDRGAPAGARLEYRLIGVLRNRREEVLGTLRVQHDALTAMGVRFLPVRPQPFRAGSTLEFSLPESRSVDLQVFDSAGRRVAIVAHGVLPAGRHAVVWNGLDVANRRVPAGVYFARLVSESQRETRRVVLVR